MLTGIGAWVGIVVFLCIVFSPLFIFLTWSRHKNKKIYRITWRYVETRGWSYTHIVKGYDAADAWKRLVKQHSYALDCIEIEEIG